MADTNSSDDSTLGNDAMAIPEMLAKLLKLPTGAGGEMLSQMLNPQLLGGLSITDPKDAAQWAGVTQRLQTMWLDFQKEQALKVASQKNPLADPAQWMGLMQSWISKTPLGQIENQKQLWDDGLKLWQGLLGQVLPGAKSEGGDEGAALPRADRRFADAKWREHPFYALVHQTYLLLAEQIIAMADAVDGVDPAKKQQLTFATRMLVDAFSPANFPLTNPLVMERAVATKGESLVKGFEHLIGDLRRGQLTHADPGAFRLGENIGATPGKVIYQSRLFEIIQYTPTTDKVMATPLVIFPAWINRFYILDLNPKKSLVAWAVEQGISTFMVSWKSADASMADVVWDDYIRAQIEAIDVVRARLKVPSVHTVGYCVAGTTLAATLAVLGARGQSDKVASGTFFVAQVDFEKAGDLKHFTDDTQLAALEHLSPEGYLDGRYMAFTFNMLRGNDLIWSYVLNHYLLGQDYPAFDMLHWNGDTTNLPALWHSNYVKELYRDNRLAQPDSLSADGTPIDLGKIAVPCFIQAGREDHIAPAESVWRFSRHLSVPWTFLLAGSGHIAGVVNPPAAKKYQYWTNPGPADSYEKFVEGATETPGSWWPYWAEWLRGLGADMVPAKGKRVPGGRGDKVLGDAPGTYVTLR